nr:group 1 glycosyltransferase [uncultured bacterium]
MHLAGNRRAEADEVYYPESAAATARLLISQPADILHLHIGGLLSGRLLGLCAFCGALPRRKSVLTFHSGGFCSSPEGQAITPRSVASFVFRRLDAIVAVNREIADFFVGRCRVPQDRVHLIPPHASIGATLKAAAELPKTLQQFFDLHDPLLLSVGLLEPEYDLPVQMETLGLVRMRHPRAGLVMIGSGSLETQLRARMAALPFSEHLLLAGDVPHKATLRAIRDCRLLLRTTLYDGDALSVREALEIGTPVIATDNGMRPPGCQLIPAPAQPELLRDKIEALLAAPIPQAAAPQTPAGTENLEAVLKLYQSLLR